MARPMSYAQAVMLQDAIEQLAEVAAQMRRTSNAAVKAAARQRADEIARRHAVKTACDSESTCPPKSS